ncbi:unnamed protein product, partial [Ectocarpus sp. 6 AP-2014]
VGSLPAVYIPTTHRLLVLYQPCTHPTHTKKIPCVSASPAGAVDSVAAAVSPLVLLIPRRPCTYPRTEKDHSEHPIIYATQIYYTCKPTLVSPFPALPARQIASPPRRLPGA